MKLEREDSGRRSILTRLRTTGKDEEEGDVLITQDSEANIASNPTKKTTDVSKVSFHWSEVPTNEKGPCNRSKHAACVHNGSLFLYGGRDVRATRKDLWKCDLRTNRWSLLTPDGDTPSMLQEHSMVAYKGRLYLFGGSLGCSDARERPLWIYDIENELWTNHQPESEVKIPTGRRCHTAVISHNAMHIYGGYIDLKGSSGELWTFVFETGHWHLSSDGQANHSPLPRHSHSAVVHDGSMWVYGGLNDLHPLGDLWKWNFGKCAWSRVRFRSGPPELYGHSAVKAANSMLVFGGQDSNGTLRQDMWRFHFASQTWDKIIINKMWPSPRTQLTFTSLVTFNLQAHAATPTTRTWSVPFFLDHVAPTSDEHRPRTSPASVEDSKRFRNRIHPVLQKRDLSPQRPNQGETVLRRSPLGWCNEHSDIDIPCETQNIWQAKDNAAQEEFGLQKTTDFATGDFEKLGRAPSLGVLGDDMHGRGKAPLPGFVRTNSVESIQITSRLQFSQTTEIFLDESDTGSDRNLLVPNIKASQSFPDGFVNRKRKTKHEKVGIENAGFVAAETKQSMEDLQLEDLEDSAALDAEFSRYHGNRHSLGNKQDLPGNRYSHGNRHDLPSNRHSHGNSHNHGNASHAVGSHGDDCSNRADCHGNKQNLPDTRHDSLSSMDSYGCKQNSVELTNQDDGRKRLLHGQTRSIISSSREKLYLKNDTLLSQRTSPSSVPIASSADQDVSKSDNSLSELLHTSGISAVPDFSKTSVYNDSDAANAFMPCVGVTSVVVLGGRTSGVHYVNKPLSVWKLDVTPLQ